MDSFDGCWSVGEPWPAPHTPQPARKPRREDPPLLALRFGPFTFSPLAAPYRPDDSAAVPAAAPVNTTSCSSQADAAEAASPELCRLRQLVAAKELQLAQQLAGTGEAVDAGFYARWLKARGGCANAAADAILAHAAWRTEFVGEAAAEAGSPFIAAEQGIPEASIADELAAGKAFLQGSDMHGCPVVVVKAARHDMGRRDLGHTKRLIAYVLDHACAASHGGQICCLFDLSGLRPRNLDVKVLLAIFELLQQHYPERLNSLYFLNAPFLFWGVWQLVAPFVHANTRRKIQFVAGRSAVQQLANRIPAQVLPIEYGGSAELVPIDAAVAARRRQQLQEQAAASTGAPPAATATAQAEGATGGAASRQARAAAALRRHAGGALGATRRFMHHKVARPVGGAAAGAARTLRHHHAQLMRRGGDSTDPGGSGESKSLQLPLSGQAQAVLVQVVLRHVLLMGLLLRILSRFVLRRAPSAPSPSRSHTDGRNCAGSNKSSAAPCQAVEETGSGGNQQSSASLEASPAVEAASASSNVAAADP